VLDFYFKVKPADPARVASAKMTPEEAGARLTGMAEATERALVRGANKEYAANRIDLAGLAVLASYHAAKIRAVPVPGDSCRPWLSGVSLQQDC
jgi:hypothetical protein